MKTRVATSTSCSRRSSGVRRAISGPCILTDWVSQGTPRQVAHRSRGRYGEGSMDERHFQLLRAGAFVLAVVVAFALQRLTPHARLRGSWLVNGGLWLLNAVIPGVVCGACAFTLADWA